MTIKSGLVIDPHNDDFGAVCNCAVRYAIGRQTYMPKLVIDYITPLLPHLTDRTLYCFIQDIDSAKSYGDPYIDKPDWMMFRAAVEKEQDRRKQCQE